jgi:hypothetical protein
MHCGRKTAYSSRYPEAGTNIRRGEFYLNLLFSFPRNHRCRNGPGHGFQTWCRLAESFAEAPTDIFLRNVPPDSGSKERVLKLNHRTV